MILVEPGLELPGAPEVAPDLAGWRRERMPAFPDVMYFDLAPDWICEVLSPPTTRLDRMRKLPIYAHAGVAWAWLIDPSKRTLEIYALENQQLTLVSAHAGEESVPAAPFDAIPLELRALWI